MLNLVRNEWLKLWSKKATWIMAILLVLVMLGSAGFVKWMNSLEVGQDDSGETITVSQMTAVAEEPEITKYRLDNELPPIIDDSAQGFITGLPSMMSVVTLLTVVVAGGIVASEFSQGTIKMLLTRPVKRWKILTSKLLTVGLFAVAMTGILLISGIIFGYIFFDNVPGTQLELVDGAVVEVSFWGRLLLLTALSLINVLVIGTLAFMIGSVFRSSSLAIGISIFLMFTGVQVTGVLAALKIEASKYILFANTNLGQYIGANDPSIEGMTMAFSIVVILIYLAVFLVTSYWSFTKRDVTA
ncbi:MULTISPECIES: ABC transporter permease subunit [unclassified Psychrobacillus]|uniref:ABC transporter permease subunit n=1 Tax=unclassified Psychrobacillus TaxID=2636677 RepID=UPI00146BAB4A|nr:MULTISPECIES: ABC transporter permease subunit [unclassified Psychrobacillus]MCM3358573.1 ABC transporter permease [Psychrobacillus sp. MER TA 171]NME05668.1 ABC transporter permease subunit [Psychrobacillus sp. BL-248-WT-3]